MKAASIPLLSAATGRGKSAWWGRRLALAPVFGMVWMLAVGAARAQDSAESLDEALHHCLSADAKPVVLMASCTAAIDSERLQPQGLALALAVRGSAYGETKRPDLGLQDAEHALATDPSALLARVVRADLRAKFRDYHGAIEDIDVVLETHPDDVRSLRRRGNFHDWLGEHDKALADFNAALAVKPDADTYVDRAVAYDSMGDDTRAIQDLDTALQLQPDNPAIFYERGHLRFRAGDFAGAAGDLGKAADSQKDDPYIAIWAYLASARVDQADAGQTLARRATELDLQDWPGPLVKLFLGQIGPDAVSPPDGGHVPWMTQGYLCESEFYLGEYYLLQKDVTKARAKLQAAIDTQVPEFVEDKGARDELARLTP